MREPSQLGRYQVRRLLGRGGMGAVYEAHDPSLDRTVALKIVRSVAGDDSEESLERFRREARAAGRLSHPNVVSVYDLDRDQTSGTPFIVMEYVDGVSLATVLAENATFPVAQALEIVEQVGAALVEAHRNGIVHRDIKPGNVFLDSRGRVKVGDFGIARLEGSDLTLSGISLGTPGYVAPEVVRGGSADARADVFALGVLAYQLLTGRRPFGGAAGAPAASSGAPDSPSRVRPEVSAQTSAAVLRALAESPLERTQSAEDFLRDLRGARTVASTVAIPPALAGAGRARSWGPAAAASLGVLVIAGAAIGLTLRSCSSPRSDPVPRAATPVRQSPRPAAAERQAADDEAAADNERSDGKKGENKEGDERGQQRGKGHAKKGRPKH